MGLVEEEDRKRDGEAGWPRPLSFISVPLSPLLLVLYSVAATDGCGGGVAAPAAFVLLPLSLSGRVPRIHSHLAAFLPSWKKKRRQKAVVGGGESRPGREGEGERERLKLEVLRKPWWSCERRRRRRRLRGEAGVGGRRSQKGQ